VGAEAGRARARPSRVPLSRNLPGPLAQARSRHPFLTDGFSTATSRLRRRAPMTRSPSCCPTRRRLVQGTPRSLAWPLGPRSRCVRGTQEGTRPGTIHQQRAPPTVVLASSGLTWSGLLIEEAQDVEPTGRRIGRLICSMGLRPRNREEASGCGRHPGHAPRFPGPRRPRGMAAR
jgi:hypothetical protein